MVYNPSQIRLYNPLIPLVQFPPRSAPWVPLPVAVVGIIYRLEDRSQTVQQRLLAHPIIDRRDANKLPRPRLGDQALENRLRHILSVPQFPVQSSLLGAMPRSHLSINDRHLGCASPSPRPPPSSSACTLCPPVSGPSSRPHPVNKSPRYVRVFHSRNFRVMVLKLPTDLAHTRLSPGLKYIRLLLAVHPFPLRLSAYRVRYGATTRRALLGSSRSSVPCRSQTPWCDGWIRMPSPP